jgi:hypothetical protein
LISAGFALPSNSFVVISLMKLFSEVSILVQDDAQTAAYTIPFCNYHKVETSSGRLIQKLLGLGVDGLAMIVNDRPWDLEHLFQRQLQALNSKIFHSLFLG